MLCPTLAFNFIYFLIFHNQFRIAIAGLTDRDIAGQLHIEASTVRKHIEKICGTFGLKNEFADERRTLRPELMALFAKYMPEMVSIKTQKEVNNDEELIPNILPNLPKIDEF